MPAIHLSATTLLLCAFLSVPLLAQSPELNPGASAPAAIQDAAPVENNLGEDSDSQPARVFRTTARHLFEEEKFDQLDAMAAAARVQKSRFLGGAWKLNTLYDSIVGPGSLTSTEDVWNAHIERLERWSALKPASITPRVALAEAYLRFAWKARGRGYSSTVTPDGWKLFEQRIELAKEALEKAESASAKDPEWYRVMQTVALAQGWDRAKSDDLLQKAVGFEPDYYYLYNAQANYLLPKWYGKPGDTESFAQSVADRIGGPAGDFVYLQIALHVNCCKGKPQAPDLSWDRVKQGFAALEQLYGSTNHERNALAFLAVRNHDADFAQQLFTRIGDNWDENVWGTKERFDKSKSSLSANSAN
jgi:Domain of unknown function (DUF4034)